MLPLHCRNPPNSVSSGLSAMASTRHHLVLAVGCIVGFLVGRNTVWRSGSAKRDWKSQDEDVDTSAVSGRIDIEKLTDSPTAPQGAKAIITDVNPGSYSEFFFDAVACQQHSSKNADASAVDRGTGAKSIRHVAWCHRSGPEANNAAFPSEPGGLHGHKQHVWAYFALKTTTATDAYVARTQSILDAWGRWCQGHLGIFTDTESTAANRRIACQLGDGGSVYEIPRVTDAHELDDGRKDRLSSPKRPPRDKMSMYVESQRRKLARVIALFVLNRTEEWLCYIDDDMYVVVPNLLEELRKGPCPANQQNRCFVADQQDHTASGMPYSVGAFCMTRSIAVDTHAAIASGGWKSGSDDVGFAHLVRRAARINVTNSPKWISQYSKLVLNNGSTGRAQVSAGADHSRPDINQEPNGAQYRVIKRYSSSAIRSSADFGSAKVIDEIAPYTTMSVLHLGSILRDPALKKDLLAALQERHVCK